MKQELSPFMMAAMWTRAIGAPFSPLSIPAFPAQHMNKEYPQGASNDD